VKQPERSTYLLIYAPRREVLEVWPARSGKCLRTFRCGNNCALMCPDMGSATSRGSFAPPPAQDCLVLNGTTGQLFSMAERLAVQSVH
jgi:Rab3 GTPase-activating protein regulatory subunit N-terminus